MRFPLTLLDRARSLMTPDLETWELPDRLTADDAHAETGPDWRRNAPAFQDMEDDQ